MKVSRNFSTSALSTVEFDVKYNLCKSIIMIRRTDKCVKFPRFMLWEWFDCVSQILWMFYDWGSVRWWRHLQTAHCTELYTAHLWSNYKRVSIRKLNVAYNDCLRILLKRPRWESHLFVSAGFTNIDYLGCRDTGMAVCCKVWCMVQEGWVFWLLHAFNPGPRVCNKSLLMCTVPIK